MDNYEKSRICGLLLTINILTIATTVLFHKILYHQSDAAAATGC